MIEQEPFCGVRTHFYHDASSYDMFRDRGVAEARLTLDASCDASLLMHVLRPLTSSFCGRRVLRRPTRSATQLSLTMASRTDAFSVNPAFLCEFKHGVRCLGDELPLGP